MEKLLNRLGYYKKSPKDRCKIIKYSNPNTPEENSRKLIELTVQDNEWVRNKEKDDYQLIGIFFTIVLLIERKMTNLLTVIDDSIERKMLGEKIEAFKGFLKIYEPSYDENIKEYRLLIQPLNELKNIRNSMAHDLTQKMLCYDSLTQTESYVKKRRPDLYATFQNSENEKTKCIKIIATFGLIFSFEIAKIRIRIDH